MSNPLAPIQVSARGNGSLSFICPNCRTINGGRSFDWRRARIRCMDCKKAYAVGFAFTNTQSHGSADMPFNGWTGKLPIGRVHNRLSPHGVEADLLDALVAAAYVGRIEYICPTCHTYQRERVTPSGFLPCPGCHAAWNVGVILWTLAERSRRFTPIDWIVHRELDVA